MISSIVFLFWLLVNIIFLFNFKLPVGYLVIVNFAFIIASYITEQETETKS